MIVEKAYKKLKQGITKKIAFGLAKAL